MAAHLYVQAPGEKRRPPPDMLAQIHLDEPGATGFPLHHDLGHLLAEPQAPGEDMQSFLLLALGVWAADKLLPRWETPDAWTRQFLLHLPAPENWRPLAPELGRVLSFLTGDDWELILRPGRVNLGLKGGWLPLWRPQAAVLFSGGLDSLVGAIDLLEAGRRLVLVSHYDYGQLAALQQGLAAALAAHYGPERVRHLGVRVQFPEAPELSLRSRSLLYLALGATAAAAFGDATEVLIPENGWVSLNPPLTLNRLGSYSTRTTHPHFLAQFQSLWPRLGLAHSLINPYQGRTKGELLLNCRNPGLLRELFARTVSCSRPVVSRWQRQPAGSCGYCYPCLLRRAALHRLGWDDGGDYLLDVLAAPESLKQRTQGRDLRALLLALKTWEESPAEFQARLWLGETPAEVAARRVPAQAVVARGFEEIGEFFREKGPEWIKDYLR
jgi:hypothetical protein